MKPRSRSASSSSLDSRPLHPIGLVSIRTGIPQDLLRAWERRYGAVVPARTDTGRRLYSDGDVRRFELLRSLVEAGRRIGDIAAMSDSELEELLAADSAAQPARASAPPARSAGRTNGSRSPGQVVKLALDAVQAMEGGRLSAILAEASSEFSPPVLRRDVIAPILQMTGEHWRDGTFRIANEHLATSVVRSFLGAFRPQADASAPCVVLSTPAGQRHELGALLAANAAFEVGWSPLYLGADLPAEEIAGAARTRAARAVGLSLVGPGHEAATHQELEKLRQLLPEKVPIIAGGAAADAYQPLLERLGVRRVHDLSAFQSILDALVERPT